MIASPPPEFSLDVLNRSRLDGAPEVPLYQQVHRVLRDAIRDHFEDGQTFWPELLLIEKLGVSRNTVRQALGELVREGLLLQESTKSRVVSKAATSVGIFLQIYHSDFRADLLHHIARICHSERGCDLKVFYTTELASTLDSFWRLGLSEHKIRLLLFDGAKHNLWLNDQLAARGYRTVMLDTCPPGYAGAFVGTDAGAAVSIGVNHLLNLGHRRILLLVNEPSQEETVQDKITAFEALVRDGKIEQGRVHICRDQVGSHSFDLAYNAMDEIWSASDRPTAIFTVSDPGAWGVLKWFSERRISVPAEVSVLGFEGARPGRFTQPALTSIAHPVQDLAERAVKLLFEEGGGPELLPPTLLVRESTGPAPLN